MEDSPQSSMSYMNQESPRPIGLVRSSVARTIYHRMLEDERHRHDCHDYWYVVEQDKLPADIRDKFIRFHQDTETELFLENCYQKSDWVFTQVLHSILRSVLSWFMSSTSINGYLDRGSMFVFSHSHFQQLLGITDHWKGDNLLDLGAGDGKITQIMGTYFANVYATEASSTMITRLQERGFQVLGIEAWGNGTLQYDLIGCLNLLDRCDKPISILHSIRSSLTPGIGRVIIATVLPFKPYVETGTDDHIPTENIRLEGQSFEEQVTCLVRHVFEPAGFELERFTRLPYLCEGDLQQSFYVLDDAVFVLKPNTQDPAPS
ncbi:protein-L-histidine N-pros-methyltransferase-like [Liolophura sinensis]|uniref:protein-L-histidine N-pros-methyltransferase-like n=1 Tax=Liolophura sinensis TaxID=3198878 RepID=UPI0031593D27